MFEYNGKTYTLEQLQNVAKQKGYTFDELLNKNPNIKELGKTTPTSTGADVEETAAPDMDSKSVNTSLGLTNVLPENQKFDALGRIVDINTNEVIESTRPVDFGETVPAQVAENILLNIERLSTIDNSIGAVAGALLNKPNFFKKQLAKIEASEKRSEKLGGRGFTDISEATSISEGIGDVISGISSAFASFGASGLEIAAGGPLLLAADMASKSIIDANKIKADAAGTTIENLQAKNELDYIQPFTYGLIGAAAEYVGFKGATRGIPPGVGKKIFSYIWGGSGEMATEVFQGFTEKLNANYAAARGKGNVFDLSGKNNNLRFKIFNETFKDWFTSKEALESGLQGFVGGAGARSMVNTNIEDIIDLLGNSRTVEETKQLEKNIDDLANIRAQIVQTSDNTVLEGLKQKEEELQNKIKFGITAANGFIFNASKKDYADVKTMEQLAKLQIQKVNELKEKADNGQITDKEYNAALEGYKSAYIQAKNNIKGIVQKISDKSNKLAQEVNKIYKEKGKEGIAEILELYKPMATRLARQRRNVPGYDEQILIDEILSGERGVIDLINSYNPEKNPDVPLSAYINSFIGSRTIEASKRVLKTEFETDVTQAKAVTDTATETQTERTQEVKTALAKDLNLSEETQNEIVAAVEKTLGTKLPAVTDKTFKSKLTEGFRTELTNTLKKVFGKTAAYEQFLRDNFEKIYPAIPQETINKRFKEFNERITDETGKQLRERTAEGKKVFKKKEISKAEFLKYFLNAKGSTKGVRKTALAEVIANEVGLDNVLNALAKPEIVEKFKAIQELQGQEVPSNFIEIISEKIDRAIQKLEDYQKSGVFRSGTGIPEIIINSTIVFAKALKASIKAGKTFIDALNDAIKKFRKSLSKKYNEEELDIAENVIREEVTENNIPDFLNLADIIENNIATKRGEAYENVILKALKNANIKGLKILTKQARGSDRTKADITIEYNGKKANIEVKLNANAQYGSISLRANDNTLSTETSFKKELLELAKEKETQIEAYKKRAVELGAEITGSNLKVSKKIHEQLKNEGLQAALQGTKNVSADIISEFYNNKGVYYIQIGESGLFHLGEDILNLGTTKFEGTAEVSLRIRRAGTGLNTLTFFPKLSNWNQLSNKTIDTESGIQSVFKENKSKKPLDKQFNQLLQATTGIKWFEKFSPVKASIMGRGKGKKFFIPYSADDLVGLLYATLGKGKIGDQQMQWYQENLLRPFSRGIQKYEAAKQKALREWQALKKEAKKDVPGGLTNRNSTGFTNQDSVRIYMWTKQGMKIPGIAANDIRDNVRIVQNNDKLKSFAERIMALNPEGHPEPTPEWIAGDITTDIVSYINDVKRIEFLTEWKDNVKEIFNDDNKNKLKALYGEGYIKALDNMLYRMEKGRNKFKDASDIERKFQTWTNNSVGAIMFFNARSAVLQTLSAVNFINFSDNNPIAAAKALANFPQYVKDFSALFNSDFLKQRRSGLQTDINADEIANAAATSKNKVRGMLAAVLKFGFTPTQIADSFAIASGGATFYRNRINKYKKDGLSQQEAEQKAFTDFQEIAEETQQSARPDRISMQQAGSLGRLILAFGNTPMQYARLTKKATLDLINGRGDWKTNISKIAYYSVIQNIIFSALQQGLFALLFDDEEDEDKKSRFFRIGNSSADTLLRGAGVYGAAAATAKNIIFKIIEESKKSRADYTKIAIEATSISPPINSKLRKLESAGKTFTYKQSKEKVFTEGFSLENPAFLAGGRVLSATTNIPADRVVQKLDHIYTAMQPETELWQGIALSLGWGEWELGMIEKQTKTSPRKIKKYSKIRPTKIKR